MTGITLDGLARMRSRWRSGADLPNNQMEDLFDALEQALSERSLTEQSRIDEAVAKERERCEQEARRYAGFYQPHSDGRNTFVLLADFIAEGRPYSPTPTTEEGAWTS